MPPTTAAYDKGNRGILRLMPIESGNREKIDILYGEPQAYMRLQIRNALQREGFENVHDFDRLDHIVDRIERRSPDLIILDTAFRRGDACRLVENIRHQRVGINPFVPVIMTATEPTRDFVKRIVDCGTDDLILKPLSPGLVFDRIDVLVDRRKPFVVTCDYIGPDRRKDPTRQSTIGMIDVPNTLRAKALGESLQPTTLYHMIEDAQKEINEQRLKRNAFQISFLVELIMPDFDRGKITPRTSEHVDRLSIVAEDIGARMEGTDYEHITELCQTMINVARSIRKSIKKPDAKDIELLKPLSEAILVGFNPEEDAAGLATEISEAVGKFHERA